MFVVDEQTKRITMHRGDTGSVTYRMTGYEFSSEDRAVWTMKNVSGTIVKEHTSELTNGEFTIDFVNHDTDELAPGTYQYDVRIVIEPTWSGGKIVDGQIVTTPASPLYVELLPTVGQI